MNNTWILSFMYCTIVLAVQSYSNLLNLHFSKILKALELISVISWTFLAIRCEKYFFSETVRKCRKRLLNILGKYVPLYSIFSIFRYSRTRLRNCLNFKKILYSVVHALIAMYCSQDNIDWNLWTSVLLLV